MKHRNTLLLGMCLCALGTQAQSVTVVLKDGRSEKWPVEQVKEIYFQSSEQASEVFNDISLYLWGNGNFAVTLMNDNYTVNLDTYSPKNFSYIPTGVYTVGADSLEELAIDPSSLDYTNVEKDGVKTGITAGTMTVSNEGPIYTFTVDFTLETGEQLNGTYVGEINALSQYQNVALSSVKYFERDDKEDGEVYVKFNDSNWTFEGAIDFFCESGATTLAEGTYNLSDTKEPFTFFSGNSYVQTYSPYDTNRFSDGTITVAKNGDNYDIVMNLTFDCGIVATYTYSGPVE